VFSGTNVHETRSGNIQHSQHAEMSALQKFVKFTYGKKCNLSAEYKNSRGRAPTIYVVRLSAHGYNNRITTSSNCVETADCWYRNSLPCANCQKNLKKFGIQTIKYTTIDRDISVMCELKLN